MQNCQEHIHAKKKLTQQMKSTFASTEDEAIKKGRRRQKNELYKIPHLREEK